MLISVLVALLAAPMPAASSAAAPSASGFHLLKSIPIAGDGGWDYLALDADSQRLFVTHGDRVDVLDLATERVVGEIKDTAGVHGVALAPALKRGFTTNGRANTVTIFDLGSLAKLAEVKTGVKPDAILFDPATQRVFAFNGGSSDTTVIDAAAGTVAATIALGGQPEFSVTDGLGTVFVNLEDKSELVAIDAKALAVKSRWSLAPCEEPSGLAIDTQKRRLFSVCRNQLMAISDADKGQVLATVPIGRGVDGAGFDPGLGLAFSSNGEGTLTVVREDLPGHFAAVDTVKTQAGARTLTLDPRSHRVYSATAQFGPPPPATTERPHPRPAPLPGTFVVLVVGQ